MLGSGAFLSILQFVLFLYLPESPRYLIRANKVAEGRAVLQRVWGTSGNQVHEAVEKILATLREREINHIRMLINNVGVSATVHARLCVH